MQSSHIIEVASYKFKTVKKSKDFIYEIKLLKHSVLNEYSVLRRWYYVKNQPMTWIASDWSDKSQEIFERKIIQKRDIFKYELIENIDKRIGHLVSK